MKRQLCIIVSLLALSVAAQVSADTVAYWRFEDGTAGTNVTHIAGPDAGNTFSPDILDVSGNGNHLSAWITGGCCGYQYRADVPAVTIPETGAANTLSVKNTGGGPGMFTNSTVANPTGINIDTMTPGAFTIEASWKPEAGGHRTVVGRDAQNVVTGTGALAAVYLQARPDNSVGIGFADQAGNFHEAYSAPGLIQGFSFGSDPDGLTGTWYNLAAVSDGSTLSMYVNSQLVASTPIVSANPNLAVGTTDGGDWNPGGWSVGRGLFNGGHGDRAYGFIDEVRISNSALLPNEFLFPVPTTLELIVDKTSGAVTLTNSSASPVTIDFYRIASEAGALKPANGSWLSLDDQNYDAIDGPDALLIAGDSPGEGWDQAGGSSINQLIEQFLGEAGSTINGGESISLGNAYNTSTFGALDGDLQFSFALLDGAEAVAPVTYVGVGGLDGDFDGNTDVDGYDILAWQRGLGGDFDAGDLADWKANFGAGADATAAVGAVPEPSSIVLMLAAGLLLAARRTKSEA